MRSSIRAATWKIATNEQLRSIVDRHLIVVQASARALARAHGSNVADRPGYREALIEAAITTNAALASHTLQAELHGRGLQGLKAVYGVFLLDGLTVWTPVAGSSGLGEPPGDLAGLIRGYPGRIGADRVPSDYALRQSLPVRR